MTTLNGGNLGNPSSRTTQPGFVSPDGWFDFFLTLQPERPLTTQNSNPVTEKDLVFSSVTTNLAARDHLFNIISRGNSPISFSITNGGGCTQDTFNPKLFKSLINGATETVTISSAQRTVNTNIQGLVYLTNLSKVFQSYAPTSLARHCTDAIDNRLIGKTASNSTKCLWDRSPYDAYYSSIYIRNPNLWCADIDFTCYSPRNTYSGLGLGLTAITPRHLIGCGHAQTGDTETIVTFVSNDNTLITRTIVANKRHPLYIGALDNDIWIYLLDSDLPTSITPVKLLPFNTKDYLPNLNLTYTIPAIGIPLGDTASVFNMREATGFNSWAWYTYPQDNLRNPFIDIIGGGASGKPNFLLINNKLVLASVWSTTAPFGTFVGRHIPAINQLIIDVDAIAGINTGYQVSTVDLSAFPTY